MFGASGGAGGNSSSVPAFGSGGFSMPAFGGESLVTSREEMKADLSIPRKNSP